MTAATGATEGRLPTAGEVATEAVVSGVPELAIGAGGKLLYSLRGKSKLAETLGEEVSRAGKEVTLAGEQASQAVRQQQEVGPALRATSGLGFGRTAEEQFAVEGAVGNLLKRAHPRIAANIRKDTQRLYQIEKSLGENVPATPPSNKIVESAQDAKDVLEHEDLTPEQKSRVVKVLDRIIDRGSPGTIKGSPAVPSRLVDAQGNPLPGIPAGPDTLKPAAKMTYNDYLKWESDLREVAPRGFINKVHPDTQSKGVLSNIQYYISQELDNMATKSPALANARRSAKDFFRSEVIPDREMVDAIGSDKYGPNDVVQMIVTSGRSDILKRFLARATPVEQQATKAAFFSQKLREATDATGQLDAATFLKSWRRIRRANPENIQLLSGAGRQGNQVAELITQLEKGMKEEQLRTGQVKIAQGRLESAQGKLATEQQRSSERLRLGFVGGTVVDGLIDLKNGHIVRGFSTIAMAPIANAYFSSTLTRPQFVNMWLNALKSPKGSRLALRFGRLLAQDVAHAFEAVSRSEAATTEGGRPLEGLH